MVATSIRRILCLLLPVVLVSCKGEPTVCEGVDCDGHGSCVEADGRPACLCDPGYVQHAGGCAADPCAPAPCVHGTCHPDGAQALCSCEPGYAGARCDTCAPGYRLERLACVEGSPCEGDPCVYGSCRSQDGLPVCECFLGYEGELCERCAPGYHPENLRCVSDTACDPDPCVHGSCREESGQAVCTCDAGYAGDRCEACAPGYHEEGLICVPDIGGPCDPNPCQEEHRSLCAVDGDGFVCRCDAGYHDEAGACVPDTACNPDPCTGLHQSGCAEDGAGGYTCLCETGYQDHDSNLSCLPTCSTAIANGQLECDLPGCDDSSGTAWCIGGPCEGVTCSGHGSCEVQGSQPVCICDLGFQDHDGNNTCRPDCATSGLDCGALSCEDVSGEPLCVGVRSCVTVVRYDPGGESISMMYIRGEFNGWSLSHPFTPQPDGTFSVELDLEPGDHAYKLYDQGRDRWFEDPGNPYFQWVDGVRNSRLRVPDCDQPMLRLVAPPVVGAGSIQFQVFILDGAQGTGIDPGSIEIYRNGVPVVADFDASTGLLSVQDPGLDATKHTYRIRAADNAGREADRLYVPVWIESEPFAWEDAVLYFVLTDRFADGDGGNNLATPGVDPKANWQGGDFAGIRARIESGYFDDLGVDALWISSITQNTAGAGLGTDGRLYSAYHSYWPVSTGWRDDHPLPGLAPADPHFGTLEEFKQLVQTAHAHGIRVLVDFVANHVHDESPLWQDHHDDVPAWFHDLYVCGWDQPITCWFAPYLPDFEYKNLDVLDTVVEHAVWLIQETDVDGFRLDAVKHMIDDFSYAIRARIQESVTTTDLRFYMVGETFTGEGQGSADLIKHYVRPEMLDGQFDFPLYWQIVKTFLREEQDFRGLEAMLQWNQGYYGEFAVMSNFLGNHDVARALSHAAGDIADMWGNGSKEQGWVNPPGLPAGPEAFQRLRLAWTFLMTVPGVPLIYYGDEYGMPGAGDPDNRRFMLAEGELSTDQQATLDHIRKLTAARSTHPSLRRGSRAQLHMDADGLFWAYGLTHPGDKAIVVFNRRAGEATRALSVAGLGLADGVVLRDAIHNATVTVSGGVVNVTLAGRDSAVFVRE